MSENATPATSLSAATGPVGHVLAGKPTGMKLGGTSIADLADQVFPALTASVRLLGAKAPQEVENFRDTVVTVVDAASRAHHGQPGPAETAMIRKITAALDAARPPSARPPSA